MPTFSAPALTQLSQSMFEAVGVPAAGEAWAWEAPGAQQIFAHIAHGKALALGKAHELLGYAPQFPSSKGIPLAYRWWREWHFGEAPA